MVPPVELLFATLMSSACSYAVAARNDKKESTQ
jgi:hypothetical protein